VDPTPEQWQKACEIMKRKGHFPVFDTAYQGFASGDLDKDAYAVRLFVQEGFEMMVCQSFAKNMGLYGQRVGNFLIVFGNAQPVEAVRSQVCKIIRAIYSNPPSYGARIAEKILTTPVYYEQWKVELKEMADRIQLMRKVLFEKLTALQTPGSWNHIIDQIGMFSYTGLSPTQSKTLVEKFHIYLTSNGRISMAGLNTSNIDQFAKAMDWVVRNVQ
jgi:aspartate aminotransferase